MPQTVLIVGAGAGLSAAVARLHARRGERVLARPAPLAQRPRHERATEVKPRGDRGRALAQDRLIGRARDDRADAVPGLGNVSRGVAAGGAALDHGLDRVARRRRRPEVHVRRTE